MWTVESLQAFETSIAEEFNAGHIRAPVHLEDGNEAALLDYFRQVKESDWICTTWRAHLKALLKGVPPDELRAEIMAGRSISLCFPQYRIVSSAIAGGILPIAVGIAMGIRRRGGTELVHCFVGDMMSQSGIFFECVNYANNQSLPIQFIVEDNDVSVCTSTDAAWGGKKAWYYKNANFRPGLVHYYRYESKYPHAGAGTRVQF
jgi:TPP-dependent pyruvate/acetoin dehydrogenase alpha subunit